MSSIKVTGTDITFADGSIQNTNAVVSGSEVTSNGVQIFVDRTGDNLRFKRLAANGSITVFSNATHIILNGSLTAPIGPPGPTGPKGGVPPIPPGPTPTK
jgi:hypothetical protein